MVLSSIQSGRTGALFCPPATVSADEHSSAFSKSAYYITTSGTTLTSFCLCGVPQLPPETLHFIQHGLDVSVVNPIEERQSFKKKLPVYLKALIRSDNRNPA